jgi:cytochrome c
MRRREWCVVAGVATLALALGPPLHHLRESRFAAHMVQHELLGARGSAARGRLTARRAGTAAAATDAARTGARRLATAPRAPVASADATRRRVHAAGNCNLGMARARALRCERRPSRLARAPARELPRHGPPLLGLGAPPGPWWGRPGRDVALPDVAAHHGPRRADRARGPAVVPRACCQCRSRSHLTARRPAAWRLHHVDARRGNLRGGRAPAGDALARATATHGDGRPRPGDRLAGLVWASVRIGGRQPRRWRCRAGQAVLAAWGCGTCHTIPGVPRANGLVGPPLAGFATRAYVGGVLTNTPEHVVQWIRDPRAHSLRTAMPNLAVPESDARQMAAYLLTLR